MAGVAGNGDKGNVVPVISGLAIGVFLVIVFAIWLANANNTSIRFIHESSSASKGYLYATMLKDLYHKEQTPEAIVIRGTIEEVKDILLNLVAEKTGMVRAGDGSYFIPEEQDDDQITLGLYYGKDGMNETAAVTISNYTPDDIRVHVLVLAGYIHGEVQAIESRSTVYRPVISDPYDVAGATITSPQWVLAGDSLTAYIQGDFNADGYGTSACYSFGASSPQSGNPSSHCVNIQNTWLR
jgi:hypothetical protein